MVCQTIALSHLTKSSFKKMLAEYVANCFKRFLVHQVRYLIRSPITLAVCDFFIAFKLVAEKTQCIGAYSGLKGLNSMNGDFKTVKECAESCSTK